MILLLFHNVLVVYFGITFYRIIPRITFDIVYRKYRVLQNGVLHAPRGSKYLDSTYDIPCVQSEIHSVFDARENILVSFNWMAFWATFGWITMEVNVLYTAVFIYMYSLYLFETVYSIINLINILYATRLARAPVLAGCTTRVDAFGGGGGGSTREPRTA